MTITNENKLPEVLVRALSKSDYSKNTRYSVTQILKEARPVILEQRHYSELTQDITERLWSFLGSSIHNFLEKGEDENSIIEERLKYSSVSGKFDYYDAKTKTLYDYKITSVWTLVFNNLEDHQKQLSIYAYFLREAGFEVEKIANIFILRDWKKTDYERGVHSISAPIQVKEHPILEKINGLLIPDFLDERIEYFENAEKISDENLPYCTPEYRWAEKSMLKIYWNESTAKKPSSLKNYDPSDREMAEKYLAQLNEAGKGKKTYRLELVKGNEYKRCDYCSVSEICSQFKEACGENQ
ncbi:MAG TPA: hypothetical protein DHW82_09655 [Spirochaetia bacterium]|nr:MAG: hypothetical protein A2Y41_00500 [Spirochaetes bacterium GWB1_36_13]HCL57256.1 hypothetical protein [Spirochaetia bacterium]